MKKSLYTLLVCLLSLSLFAKDPKELAKTQEMASPAWAQAKIDHNLILEFSEQQANKSQDPVRIIIHLFNQDNVNFSTVRAPNATDIVASAVEAVQDEFLAVFNARSFDSAEMQIIKLMQYQYAVVGQATSLRLVEKLAGLDEVQYVELDKLNQLLTVEGRALVGSDDAAANGYTGSGVGVAVIDSHFDLLHPELGGSTSLPNGVVRNGQNYSDPGTSIHSQNFNDCYHGTGTASIVRRYASDADLYCLTVFPNAYDSVIADAMNWCITNKNGSNGGAPIRVISMSLGGGRYYNVCDSGLMHDAAGDCLSNGILVFAASGNDGYTNSMGSPACSTNVISVGSVWDENNADYSPFPPAYCSDSSRQVNERTCYSDTASFLDIYAPSEEVMCAQCGGGTFALGGTSSACPAAAGMTAQMLQAAPSYIGQKSTLLSRYQSTGVSVIGDSGKYRIDLMAAIGGTTTPAPTATFSASPTTITEGGSATLSWTTTNATSVSITNVGSVSPASSGSVSVSPTSTTTYTLTATGAGGSVNKTVTVTVNPASGGGGDLQNGVAQAVNLSTNATVAYTVVLPANVTTFTVTMTGSGDLDLYVKNSAISWPGDKGSHNTSTFKAPYKYGSAESVTFENPAAGTWHVFIHGYSAGSGTVTASWEVSGGGGGGEPQWYYESFSASTPHKYSNYQTYEAVYQKAGAQQVGIHFDELDTERNYDWLYVYDRAGNQLYKVSGDLIANGAGSAFGRTDGWLIVQGDYVRIKLVTDYSVTDYGYDVDNAAYFQ